MVAAFSYKKASMLRYAVFIDGGYLRKVLSAFKEPKICYQKLSDFFSQNDVRLRTYYYDCAPFQSNPPTAEERNRKAGFDRFLNNLERNVTRFQSRLGRLQRLQTPKGDKFSQKMVDVLLAVDLVRLSSERQIQRAVLIAGDSDFVPAIQVARDAGVVVQLYHGDNPRPHWQLLQNCDERYIIGQDMINSILL